MSTITAAPAALLLHFAPDQTTNLTRLLAYMERRLVQRPELLTCKPGLGHPYFTLSAELTTTYGTPGMLHDATSLRIAFREDGCIYSLGEAKGGDGGTTGGWMGSCIPEGRLEAFARAWLEQTDPQRVEQIALF